MSRRTSVHIAASLASLSVLCACDRSAPGEPAATAPASVLAALKVLHEERRILFHGHEPLDTDTTPTKEWALL